MSSQFHRTVSAKVKIGAILNALETVTRGTAIERGMMMSSDVVEGGMECT